MNINESQTILIVDDNTANLQVLYEILANSGYHVIPAEDAQSALLRLQHVTPDLILLDIIMPEVNGFELYAQIRAHSPTANTPIIFISALDDRKSIDHAFELGAIDYVTKPFRSAEILGRIATHLHLISFQQSLMSSNDQLQRFQDYLKEVLDAMPSMVIGIDKSCLVTHWNRQSTLITQIETKQAVGQPVGDLLPMLSGQMQQIINAVATGSELKLERIINLHKGKQTYIDVLIYPLKVSGFEGAVIRIDDVTEQTRMEQLMIQSEKMLSVGGLAGGMAHELNSPLGGMIQGIQNIRRRFSSELTKNIEIASKIGLDMKQLQQYLMERQIDQMLDSVINAGERASNIVNNLLRFSRKPEISFQLINLEELLEQAVELAAVDYDLKKHFNFSSIIIERDYQPKLPSLNCIPGEILQVIHNLLRNAAQAFTEQHNEPWSPRIIMRTRQVDDQLQFEIEDNGSGMDEETCRRSFEPFFSTRQQGKGTGLGLSVSYYIVHDEHGGNIKVDSLPGKGSKFTISLPLQRLNISEQH